MLQVHWLEIPLRFAGLLLRLLSFLWILKKIEGSLLLLLQFLLVLAYSGLGILSLFSLFEDQALKLVGFFVDVLSCLGLGLLTLLFRGPSTDDASVCCGTFLFWTQSTLSWLEDQVPNYSHLGKTLS